MVKIVGGEFGCFCSEWKSTFALCLSSGSQPQRLFICTNQFAFSNLTPVALFTKMTLNFIIKEGKQLFLPVQLDRRISISLSLSGI